MLNICEIFHSLQGESTFAGLPCIFIRLTECNLRCTYCDTTYSYAKGKDYSIERVLAEIALINCRLVEITGGEPLLQSDVIPLMKSLNQAGYQVLLETNGSISIQPVPAFVHVIMDVKLPGSGQFDSFLMDNLQHLTLGHDELKFVIKDLLDFDTAINFVKKNKLFNHILLFSPVMPNLPLSTLADWIKASGLPLRLNVQLHKIIWGADASGV